MLSQTRWTLTSRQLYLAGLLLLVVAIAVRQSEAAQPLPAPANTPTCTLQPGSQCKSSYSKGPTISGGQCRIMQQCCRTPKDNCPSGTKLYYLGEIGTGNTACYECL